MTDRELLELAAKAAGMLVLCEGQKWPEKDIGWFYCEQHGIPGLHSREKGHHLPWRPLHDDGDALRLAGKLELDLTHRVVSGKRVEVLAAGGPLIQEFYEGEPYAAVRRAIVRAAAEVALKRATKEPK